MAQERVERRLAAILAADMVGYSRLMEVDEAGTLAETDKTKSDLTPGTRWPSNIPLNLNLPGGSR